MNGLTLQQGQKIIMMGRSLGKSSSIYQVMDTCIAVKKDRKKVNKNCYLADKPIYSNTRMQDTQHKVWAKIFPHAAELKASSWRKGPAKKVMEWLDNNVDKDNYRFTEGSRYIYFKYESDRNLIVLTLDDILLSENPLIKKPTKALPLP
jgi:hypothetical protein